MCLAPLTIFDRNPGPRNPFNSHKVPCGQCIECRISKSRSWAIRCLGEASLHGANSFVTLTYDDDHLVDDDLHPDHFRLFLKNLRRSYCEEKIRCFGVGEYGDQFGRPHYHAILFGCDDASNVARHWPYGFTSSGTVTFDSAMYVAKYCVKDDSRFPERRSFRYHSTAPGIGHGVIGRIRTPYLYVEGSKVSLPRYYKDRIAVTRLRRVLDKSYIDVLNSEIADSGDYVSVMNRYQRGVEAMKGYEFFHDR